MLMEKRELTADLDIQWHSAILLVYSHQIHYPHDIEMFVLELHGDDLRLLGIGRQTWKVLVGAPYLPVVDWGHRNFYRYTGRAKVSCFANLIAFM